VINSVLESSPQDLFSSVLFSVLAWILIKLLTSKVSLFLDLQLPSLSKPPRRFLAKAIFLLLDKIEVLATQHLLFMSSLKSCSLQMQWQSSSLSKKFATNGEILKIGTVLHCGQQSDLSFHPLLLSPATFKCGLCTSHSPIDKFWVSTTIPISFFSFCPFSL